MSRSFILAAVLSALVLSSHCAAFNRKNTPLVGLVEEHLVPEKMPARALAAPLYLPPGIVGGLLDVFIIHPIMEIPAAWEDTVDLLWTGDAGYVTAAGSLPIRALFTPVWFSLDLLARSALDFHRSDTQTPLDPDDKMALAEIVQSGDDERILKWLQSHEIKPADQPLLRPILERSKSADLRHRVINELGRETLFAQNEAYLIERLGRERDEVPLLAEIFLSNRSAKGGRALLDRIASKDVPPEESRRLIEVVLQMENPELTGALLKRIRTGRE